MTTVIPLQRRDDPFADGNAEYLSVYPENATNQYFSPTHMLRLMNRAARVRGCGAHARGAFPQRRSHRRRSMRRTSRARERECTVAVHRSCALACALSRTRIGRRLRDTRGARRRAAHVAQCSLIDG
ncbi:hypothetical protein [Burkholderia dolosa]|uniref:hypothetical protein n=1 Tax=Burkholderia dolosa TaxID=152500 RepID=UPI0027D22B1C|nr:hypothetical protein [Burkholderia dolosa]